MPSSFSRGENSKFPRVLDTFYKYSDEIDIIPSAEMNKITSALYNIETELLHAPTVSGSTGGAKLAACSFKLTNVSIGVNTDVTVSVSNAQTSALAKFIGAANLGHASTRDANVYFDVRPTYAITNTTTAIHVRALRAELGKTGGHTDLLTCITTATSTNLKWTAKSPATSYPVVGSGAISGIVYTYVKIPSGIGANTVVATARTWGTSGTPSTGINMLKYGSVESEFGSHTTLERGEIELVLYSDIAATTEVGAAPCPYIRGYPTDLSIPLRNSNGTLRYFEMPLDVARTNVLVKAVGYRTTSKFTSASTDRMLVIGRSYLEVPKDAFPTYTVNWWWKDNTTITFRISDAGPMTSAMKDPTDNVTELIVSIVAIGPD